MTTQHPELGQLDVDFLGLTTRAVGSFTFGRAAELVLDADNLYLHGEAGEFRPEAWGWVLCNVGSTLHFRLLHQTGQRADLPPSTSTAVPAGHGRVRITAGPTTYEFDYFLQPVGDSAAVARPRTGTLFYGRDLTPAQADYALTLAEPRLRGSSDRLPTKAEIANLWGVGAGTVDRTFQDLRDRLRNEGVRGIDSPAGLVEYLVVNDIITVRMLDAARLHSVDGPRRRASMPTDP